MPMLTRRTMLAAGAAAMGAPFLARQAWAADPAPHMGGTLIATWGGFEPQAAFVPAGGGSSPEFSSTKVLERLLTMRSDYSFAPTLAESVTANSDFTVYTAKIRQGVKWHDGTDFTPEDVVFSALEYWETISPANSALPALKSVEAKDGAVLFTFTRPMPEFMVQSILAGTGGLVLPKHVYSKGDIITNPANNAPIGTGPWKFKEWNRGSYIGYSKFDGYWNKGQPYLNQLILRYFRDPASRSAAMEAGELHIGVFNPLTPPDTRRLVATGKFKSTTAGYNNSNWQMTLEMNQRNPILAKVEVRQALLYAINRKFIADTVYFGFAKPSIGIISQNNKLFASTDVPHFDFDPKKAEAMLDAAGYKRGSNGKRFKVNLLAANWFIENPKVGAYLQQAFGDIGLDVNLTTPDRPTSLKRIYTDYDYDLAISNNSNQAEPVPQSTNYFATSGIVKGVAFRNATGYSNPKMDGLIEAMATEVDPTKRKATVQAWNAFATSEACYVPLVDMDCVTVANARVHGYTGVAGYLGSSWGDTWMAA